MVIAAPARMRVLAAAVLAAHACSRGRVGARTWINADALQEPDAGSKGDSRQSG
jgi:hypothetical protein